VSNERQRLFVAVAVPADVRAAVSDAAEALRGPADARWTDPAGWHLTLAFLGGVDAAVIPEVGAALARVAGRHAPVDLHLTGEAGLFGRRVLWAGIADSPGLAALADDVRGALEPLGFARDERRFHAHLTLARARKGGGLPRDLASRYAGPVLEWRVETLDLMRSHLGRAGARYERAGAWPLAGAASGGAGI
jgi:RNA 2',3'-cyclic 3'-phosphodiesterase